MLKNPMWLVRLDPRVQACSYMCDCVWTPFIINAAKLYRLNKHLYCINFLLSIVFFAVIFPPFFFLIISIKCNICLYIYFLNLIKHTIGDQITPIKRITKISLNYKILEYNFFKNGCFIVQSYIIHTHTI